MPTAPTMQDIADRAGVNRVTVSNVLNGKFKATRSDAARRAAKIRRVARELGYRPNTAARATSTGKTGFIGMIRSPRLAYSVHEPDFEWGIDEALHARGLCLLRDIIDEPGHQGNAEAPRIVRENVVDGLLINYAFGTPAPVRDYLDRCRIPAIWINRKRDQNCVRPNDFGAAVEATRHLLAHGHTRIGYLGSVSAYPPPADQEPHYSAGDRASGYRHAMGAAGLKPTVIAPPAPPANWNESQGHMLRFFVQFLRRPDRPTALLCGGGREMLHAAALVGLRVPDDLSVMTFDNEASAGQSVAVDRMLVRHRAMGQAAVDELLALIDEPTLPRRSVVIPFEFHQAGTVGRLAAESSSGSEGLSPQSLSGKFH